MLFVNPLVDGAAWEQATGRIRRQGQLADEVEVELYQHTDELIDAFRKARDFARFVEQTEGTPQKFVLRGLRLGSVLRQGQNGMPSSSLLGGGGFSGSDS